METITVRRIRRAELGTVFGFIQQFEGIRLTSPQIMERATSYGYWVAETNGKIDGVAALLLTNSVACVRDVAATGVSANNPPVQALLAAIEQEAARMACEAVLLRLSLAAATLEPLLRERYYTLMPLEQMKGFWRDVADEHFAGTPALWVFKVREPVD